MVALAIYAVMRGKPLTEEDKQQIGSPVCSGRLGELSKEELAVTKKAITSAMRYIKLYYLITSLPKWLDSTIKLLLSGELTDEE